MAGGAKMLYECATCGSLIDPDTKETYPQSGSNAATYAEMKQQITQLQHDVLRLKNENDSLKHKGEKDDRGNGSDPDGEKPGILDGFFD